MLMTKTENEWRVFVCLCIFSVNLVSFSLFFLDSICLFVCGLFFLSTYTYHFVCYIHN